MVNITINKSKKIYILKQNQGLGLQLIIKKHTFKSL